MPGSSRAMRSSKRQAKLNFSSGPPSSPSAKELAPSVRHRAAVVEIETPRKKKRKLPEDDEEEDDSSALPTPKPTKSSTQPRRSSKRSRKSQKKIDFSNHIGVTLSESPDPIPRTQPTSSGKIRPSSGVFGKNPVMELSSSSSEEEEAVPTPRASRSAHKRKRQIVDYVESEEETSTSVAKAQDYQLGEPETSGDETFRSSPTHKVRKRKASKKALSPDFIDDGDDDEVDAEEEKEVVHRYKRDSKQSQAQEEDSVEDDEDDDDEDDAVVVGTQRRRLLRKTPEPRRDPQELEDLNEDLEFLQSSPPPPSGRLRSTAPPKPNARQKALEALKRKRQGGAVSDPDSDEDEDEDEDVSENDQVEETLDEIEDKIADEEDDFVVEDDEALGVPLPQLPLQFSAQSRMKPKDLFKYVVEWMVHKRINPAFEMQDEIYQLAFNRLDDEVTGLAGSKFKSSVWTRDFTIALTARPQILITDLGGGFLLSDQGCQACNRTTHPATFMIRFAGQPYHKKTLENVADDRDSDDSDDDAETTVDSLGREVPNELREWSVGKFCKANAETAHTLEHWRYHLNEWIVDWLEAEDYLSPTKVFKRDKLSVKKRRKEANSIVDHMEESDQIKSLYQDFRSQVNAARENDTRFGRR